MMTPNNQSNLTCWIEWLLHLHAEEIDLGLSRIGLVLEAMQLARPAPLVISVAGTNGKGSSVAMLVAILKVAGLRVGAYTSPHIQRFNERIQINGVPVEDSLIVDAFTQIEEARGGVKLTYFEFSTLAALCIFKQTHLDVVVLEVGLGGRLDAVNAVDADAALITAIGIDHIEWLGSDRSVIATEKAGIMRSGKPAVCSDGAPPESLWQYADTHGVPLVQLNREFSIEITEHDWSIVWASDVKKFPPPSLKGDFQIQNAAGVVAILWALRDQLPIEHSAICKGLVQARHPGRLESFVQKKQHWLVDVAHNPQSAKALAQYLRQQKEKGHHAPYTAIFSVLNDKDAVPMIKEIAPFVQDWLIADLDVPRASSAAALKALLLESGVAEKHILVQNSIPQAVDSAQARLEDSVLVWGSFFTVSQVYNCFDEQGEQSGEKQ